MNSSVDEGYPSLEGETTVGAFIYSPLRDISGNHRDASASASEWRDSHVDSRSSTDKRVSYGVSSMVQFLSRAKWKGWSGYASSEVFPLCSCFPDEEFEGIILPHPFLPAGPDFRSMSA